MSNEHNINFLASLKDDACVLIFTRADANRMIPDTRGPLTDNEWRNIVRKFSWNHPTDENWHEFDSLIQSNLEDPH